MASTQQIRDAFPEPVTGQTAAGHPKCDHSMGVRVSFPTTLNASGELPLIVHPAQQEAWIAFAAVMRRVGYLIRESGSGTANCRNIGNTAFGNPSLHAHLSAIDLNPSKNTGTATDQPAELQAALGAIRTKRGDTVFRNLADDRMHWQINCAKASLATGIDPATVGGVALPGSSAMAPASTQPVGTQAASTSESEEAMDKETWMRVQEAMQALTPPLYEGKEIDGRPGQDTNTSVRAFEKRMNLTQRGVMGPFGEPTSGMWPATRELLFIIAFRSTVSP
jgi:peptidoglycan hydrolase-like protein with peptidoglycan-binding domain